MTPANPENLAVLDRIYRNGAADLAKLLDSTPFQQGKATVLLRQVDAISKRMGEAADAWVTQATRDSFAAGAVAMDRKLQVIGLGLNVGGQPGEISGSFLELNQRAVQSFATQIARDLAGANRTACDSARRIIHTTSQRVLADPTLSEHLAKGLISGGSLNKISRGLRARLTDAGRAAFDAGQLEPADLEAMADLEAGYIQAGRKRMDLRKYCDLVAHHQLGSAMIHATRQRLRDHNDALASPADPYPLDLVIVTGPIARDFCDMYVGKVFSNSGQHPDWPSVDEMPEGGPLFHPNCTHDLAPFIPSLAGAERAQAGKIDPSLLGISGKDAQGNYRRGGNVLHAAKRAMPDVSDANGVRKSSRPYAPPARSTGDDFGSAAHVKRLQDEMRRGSGRPAEATIIPHYDPADATHPVKRISGFAPATSIRDAKSFAKTLGVDLRFTVKDLARANLINEGLAEAHARGMILPPTVRLARRTSAPRDPGAYEFVMRRGRAENRVLSINAASNWARDPAAVTLAERASRNWSTGDPLHVVLHELVHSDHHRRLGNATYVAGHGQRLTAEQRTLARTNVGKYAADNQHEFVAEVGVGLLAGQTYNDDVMSMYRRFGGREF